MHNCKLTRRDFVDLALDEIPGPRAKQLLAELNNCEACQVEYEALRSTLHVSSRALRSSLPDEEFWRGYHSRLQSRLLTSEAQQNETAEPASFHLWSALKRALTASVRVPLPAALALMLLLGVSFFVLQTRAQVNRAPASVATVETRTVEVPVIQEKVVTRVVYVEKKGSRSGVNHANKNEVPAPASGSDTARTALSLVDFKPTEEVKLTVIKGSSKDQKR